MPSPVKISDRLWSLAREEAHGTHRSATAQIEPWATLGRAVELVAAYRDVLALKRAGEAFRLPRHVDRAELHAALQALVEDPDRSGVKAAVSSGGTTVYTTDPRYPGRLVAVHPDGTRVPGRLEGRRFVPDVGPSSASRPERETGARRRQRAPDLVASHARVRRARKGTSRSGKE